MAKAAHPLAKPDGSCRRTALTCSRPVAAPQTRASLRATRVPVWRHPSKHFALAKRVQFQRLNNYYLLGDRHDDVGSNLIV